MVKPITKSEKLSRLHFEIKINFKYGVFKLILLGRILCTGNPIPDVISIQYQYKTYVLTCFIFLHTCIKTIT